MDSRDDVVYFTAQIYVTENIIKEPVTRIVVTPGVPSDPDSQTTAEGPAICHTPDIPVTPADKKIVLLIAILAAFVTQFDISAVTIAMPTIGSEFHMDAVALSWITTGYLLAAACLLVSVGKIADIYGRKRVYLYGIAIFTFASFLMIIAPSTDMLIAIRVLQGVGAAMIFGTGISIISSVFPPGERGKILGIYVSCAYIALTVGPFLGGVLTQHFGWRSIFFVNVPLGLAACLLILWKLKGEWAECEGESLDLLGSAIYICALVLVMLGFSQIPHPGSLLLIAAGCIAGIAFTLYEMRSPFPVLDMRLLTQNRVFAFSSLAALITFIATFAVTFLLSLDLQYTKGYSPVYAGLILIAQPLAIVVVTFFTGRLSDRFDPQILASSGIALMAIGLFGLIFLTGSSPLWYMITCLVVLGVGYGLFSPPNLNAIMGSVEKRYYGMANGINGTVRLLGQVISMGITMVLFALVIGRVEITPDCYPQFVTTLHYAFALFTVLCIIGIWASLKRGKRQPALVLYGGPAPEK
jgi:EmrB/QacA subfamily drug resistance transporter